MIGTDTEERLKRYEFTERLRKIWDEQFLETVSRDIIVLKVCKIMKVDSRKKEIEVEIYRIYCK